MNKLNYQFELRNRLNILNNDPNFSKYYSKMKIENDYYGFSKEERRKAMEQIRLMEVE